MISKTCTSTYSCPAKNISNAIYTDNIPTSPNQAWQGTTPLGACYFTCDSTHTYNSAKTDCSVDKQTNSCANPSPTNTDEIKNT